MIARIHALAFLAAGVMALGGAALPAAADPEVTYSPSGWTRQGAQDFTPNPTYDTGGANKVCCPPGGGCRMDLDDGQSSGATASGNVVSSTSPFHIEPNHGPNGDSPRQYTLTLTDHCFIFLPQINPRTGRNYIEVDSGHDFQTFIIVVTP